jgi:hypothetical protein
MESSLEFFQIDNEFHWGSWSESQRKHFALRTMFEWVASDNFKVAATYGEVYAETIIGKTFLSLQAEDQFWKDEKYQSVREVVDGIVEFWIDENWVAVETTRKGRPRRAEHSPKIVSKALRYTDLPFVVTDGEEEVHYKSVKWSKSILGETVTQTWVRLVVMKDNLFKEIYKKTGSEFWTGCTKEEIAGTLGLPKTFVNEMCRWLVETGSWKLVRTTRGGKTRRELRLSYV